MRSTLSLLLLLLCAFAGAQIHQPVKWRTYKVGQYSNLKNARTQAILTEGDYITLLKELTGEEPAKDVKWNDEFLVIVALGQRPSSAHSLLIEGVNRTAPAEVTVSYVELVNSGMAAQAITSPYEIIRVDRVSGGGHIEFRKADTVHIGGGGGGNPLPTVSWRTYQSELHGNIREASTLVIDGQREFDRYWRRLTDEDNAPGDIDWTSEMLVAVHLGNRRSTGFDVLIESVEPSGLGLLVRYIERAPARGRRVRNTNTSPYTIIRLPRVQGQVLFEKRVWDSSG